MKHSRHMAYDGRMKGLIIMLRSRGLTYKQIGKSVHCGRETARRYCTEYRVVKEAET